MAFNASRPLPKNLHLKIGRSQAYLALFLMEEMNDAKDCGDLGRLYFLLTLLVGVYLRFYEEHTGSILTPEDKEDVASDIAYYMIYEKELHKKAQSKYFWWSYISRTTWFKLVREAEKEQFAAILNSFITDPFDRNVLATTDRDFYRLTDNRLESIILDVTLLDLLNNVRDELGSNSYVVRLVKNRLKQKSTDDLLKLYRKLTKTYNAEIKACRAKLNEVFYRKPPRLRSS